MRKILITGSSGLIGSEVAVYFNKCEFLVHGLDNNQRAEFFGPSADTRWRQQQLQKLSGFHHHELDLRDRQGILDLIQSLRPDVIVNAAAQPSHDRAAGLPFADFDINAVGTLNLLEAARRFCPESPFIQMSTNKVYGDRPNHIPLVEQELRWEFADASFTEGIPETLSIDQSKHSLFGASKLAADLMTQEYGRYFGMPTCCLRGGCLTGPAHSGVELHGFLSYLVRCNLEEREYTIYGYQGKQVRDNLHAVDVAHFIHAFIQAPRIGEVYNLGGGKENSISILEALALVEACSGKPQRHRYTNDPRIGDHICYYSDLRKTKLHFPTWQVTRSLRGIIEELVAGWQQRLGVTDRTAYTP